MTNSYDLGFDWKSIDWSQIQPAKEPKKPPFILKKMMSEYVWDLVHIEDNPYSFLEVQTVLDGVTVAGHKLFDQMQVLNQRDALMLLAEKLTEDTQSLDRTLVFEFHSKVAKEEALEWGSFRSGQVGIGGTNHLPPKSVELPEIFEKSISHINGIENPIERAFAYYFWGARNQFFYDGNKRTSRVIMNYILMTHGCYYLSIPGKLKDEFNQMMVDFYNKGDATEGMKFLISCYKNFD